MLFLARIITLAFNIYLLGLIIYTVLSWINGPSFVTARKYIEKYYEPFLVPLRNLIKPIKVGTASAIDLTPAILFIGVTILKQITLSLILGMP